MKKIGFNDEIAKLLQNFETSQYNHVPDFSQVKNLPILSRQDLRQVKMEKGFFRTNTSGSTGEPVTVEKTIYDHLWHVATNIREIKWRNWNPSLTMSVIKPSVDKKVQDYPSWGIPQNIAKNQGKLYLHYQALISELQAWLEEKNPHYLHGYPSVIKQLDLSKVKNLIDVKSTGENGGTMFSSEECGTIAIQCPTNKQNYHVMENQIVETNENNELIVTTLTNPYIKRYKNGDIVELGKCSCGRSLQTITKIYGRVRNMFTLPNGDKKWPIFGSRTFHEKYGIKQFKVIQKSISDIDLQIIADTLHEKQESAIKKEMMDLLGAILNIQINYVDSFNNYKHEEFVSLL